MLTRNWYELSRIPLTGIGVGSVLNRGNVVSITGTTISKGSSSNSGGYINFYTLMGLPMTKAPSNGHVTATTTSSGYYGVLFGDGTTEPTIDDYKHAGNQLKSFTCTQVQRTGFNDDGSSYVSCLYTITNSSDEDFTISEVCAYSYVGTNGGTMFYYSTLVDRTLLDEPVTIPAGGVGQVTYTIRMNYPT